MCQFFRGTAERTYLRTWPRTQYRDGHGRIIQISAPRVEILGLEARPCQYGTINVPAELCVRLAAAQRVSLFMWPLFPFSAGSRWIEINRMAGRSGGSLCLPRTRAGRVSWVTPTSRSTSRTSMTTPRYSRRGSTSATSPRTAPQVRGKVGEEPDPQCGRIHVRPLPCYNHADITFPRPIQELRDVELGDLTLWRWETMKI